MDQPPGLSTQDLPAEAAVPPLRALPVAARARGRWRLRRGARLGKYRIEQCLAEGGFARVYRALDTIEGIRVAIKVAKDLPLSDKILADFRSEVRIHARLDHPNILPVKDATIIDRCFVIVYPLGLSSLDERLKRRLSAKKALDYAGQLLAALAHAHERRVLHCDVKPENLILFAGGRLRLADFGIARFALRTLPGSGSGTLGYMAPEQAMGKPSFRSDVFSAGLVIYRMLSGRLPEWPFSWPPPGIERVRRKVHPDLVRFLERCLAVSPRRRFRDAVRMEAAFRRIRPHALRGRGRRTKRGSTRALKLDWRRLRFAQFLDEYRGRLELSGECPHCGGPVGEAMRGCPWCGRAFPRWKGESRFPSVCPRCARGLKLDWRYCPWCYGAGFEADSRRYKDKRYTARCHNPRCRRELMPFMRYCPWCRRKTTRKWRIKEERAACRGCGWGIAEGYWEYCPWCLRNLRANEACRRR